MLLALTLAHPSVSEAKRHGKKPQALPFKKPRAPWSRRYREGVKDMPWGMPLINPDLWPPEPDAPHPVRANTFSRALRRLCGKRQLVGWKARAFSRWIITSGRQFKVDPFLLGGLIFRQSRCDSTKKTPYGIGLAGINFLMHARFMHRRRYRYWVLEEGAWAEKHLALTRYPFTKASLLQPKANIYFAAAHLHIYMQQCPDIDSRFGSVPHRHPISHFIWGDRVKDAGLEDRLLRARRRLIQYYTGVRPPPQGTFKSLKLHCPLDGPPRKIASGFGVPRNGGRRRHRGIDFVSTAGEPVRAVASGTVIKAGTDLPGRGFLPRIRRWGMGPGGLFVMIQHAENLRSAYMHLSGVTVRMGQRVRGGQIIGYVGKSGTKRDPPHLHFELRHDERHIDPTPHLGSAVFPPEVTVQH
jgi:murein DD-endopeptidase MepM/ murein hydrolase activator NlpD